MHVHGPNKMFFWPSKDDTCWVCFFKILHIATSLTAISQLGQIYKIAIMAIVKLAFL